MTIDDKCVVEFKGRKIDPTKIENPKLSKIFKERVHNGESFLFNYGDHEDQNTEINYEDDRLDDYDVHLDHRDRHKDYNFGTHGGGHNDRHTDS